MHNELGTNTVQFMNTFRIKDELGSTSNSRKQIVDELGTKVKTMWEYWTELGTTAYVMKRLRYRIVIFTRI